MPPAVIGGAIAGVGAIGSAVVGAKAAKSAAKASQAGADASAAVQREIYGQNRDILSPSVARGDVAGNYINAFLGLPQDPTSGVNWGSYVQGNPDALANWNAIKNTPAGSQFGGDINAFGQYHYQADGSRRDLSGFSPGQVTTADAQNAFGNYLKNSDYGFQFATGSNAVNSGYAGAGTLQSGAAMKALEGYRQNLQAGYRNEYMNALGNQQGVGLSAGSALAGVGQNYANSLGSIYTGNAANQANAKLVGAANTGQAINSLATIGANIFGSGR